MKKILSLIRVFAFFFGFCGTYSLGFGAETVKFESEIKDGLALPVDVALNANGQLIVLDAQNGIVAFDAQNVKLLGFPIRGNLAEDQKVFPGGAMGILPNGRVIVAENDKAIGKVFSLEGEWVYSIGVPGNLPGQFKALTGIETDIFGFVYAVDRDNKRLQIFTPGGIFIKHIDLSGSPADVALDRQGNIYALLPDVGKIEKFSSDGKKIAEIVSKVNNKDQIQKSSYLHVDLLGNIFLTQLKEQRIVKTDPSGNVLISFGSEGAGRGQFSQISDVAVDETGRVYVADTGNGRVQIFKISNVGTENPMPQMTTLPLLVDFDSTIDVEDGVSDIFSLPGKGLFTVSDKNNHLAIWGEKNLIVSGQGSASGELLKPSAIYVTLDSRIFVADTANHRVQIFNYDGSLKYEFGKNGNKPGQFNSPQGIAVNGKGMIFVADTLNNRVEIFNQDGIYLNAIGQEDSLSDEKTNESCQALNLPKVLAVDSKDQLYVVDERGQSVMIFDEKGGCLGSIEQTKNGGFAKIVDMAFDQNDNLYIADAPVGQVHIFDAKKNFVLSFGSLGEGRGYFKQLSSLTASENRIFVADYASKQVQVFRYSPDGLLATAERLNTTKTASPSSSAEHNEVLRYTLARNLAYDQATKEFIDSLGFSKEYLLRFVRIDSVESLNDGNVKVTISIPKFIPREIKPGG